MTRRESNSPRVLFVFLPNDNDAPLNLAQELLSEVGALPAEVGIDPLTGGVEIRIPYNTQTLENIRRFLTEHDAVFDISQL
jgi:hypothetical protein